MSVALAANAPATFEIKSANLPLVALLLKSADLARLSEELAQRFGDMPDFFDQDPLVIDLSPLQGTEAAGLETALDFAALADLLRQYRLQPIAVRGGSDAQTAAALAAGADEVATAIATEAAQMDHIGTSQSDMAALWLAHFVVDVAIDFAVWLDAVWCE